MSQSWVAFREFVERNEDLPVGWMMRATCHYDPGDEVIAAYDAPFLGPESKVAMRALPMSIPRTDKRPEGVATLLDALRKDPRPLRIIWGRERHDLDRDHGGALRGINRQEGRRVDPSRRTRLAGGSGPPAGRTNRRLAGGSGSKLLDGEQVCPTDS